MEKHILFNSTEQLVPDSVGNIELVAISMPPIAFDKNNKFGCVMANVLKNFLYQCVSEINVLLIVEQGYRSKAEDWLSTIEPNCNCQVADTPDAGEMTEDAFWIRDTMIVLSDGLHTSYLNPKHDRNSNQKHGIWISDYDNNTNKDINVHLAGGNQLITHSHQIVGAESIKNTAKLTTSSSPTLEEAAKKIESIDYRSLVVYEFTDNDHLTNYKIPIASINDAIKDLKPGITLSSQLKSRIIYSHNSTDELVNAAEVFNGTDPQQYPFHLDLVLSATGIAHNGKELLLLAELELPEAQIKPDQKTQMIQRNKYLAATSINLENKGFIVKRNPVPFHYGLTTNDFHLRFYNNVLLDGSVRTGRTKPIVWIPGYGDNEAYLESFDQRNITIWENLGFEARLVLGWSDLAIINGALRCATQVLSRS